MISYIPEGNLDSEDIKGQEESSYTTIYHNINQQQGYGLIIHRRYSGEGGSGNEEGGGGVLNI